MTTGPAAALLRISLRDRGRLAFTGAVASLVLTVAVGASLVPAPRRADDGDRKLHVSTLDLTGERRAAVLSGEGMIPGDEVDGALTLANPGSSSLTYRMVHGLVATEDTLAAALVLEIRTIGRSCDDFDGSVLYQGPISAATFGHPPQQPRALAAASAEILCFRAQLPLDAGNALQGAATSVSFRFDSEWDIQ